MLERAILRRQPVRHRLLRAGAAAQGFANASLPACGATPSLVRTPANLVTPDTARTFAFADGVHPTTAAQTIESQYAISVLKLSDRALVGAMFNYSENKADYGGAGFKLTEPMGTLYGVYKDGPWYVGASLGGGGRLQHHAQQHAGRRVAHGKRWFIAAPDAAVAISRRSTAR